jgi:hypothetical protein
MKNKIYEYLLFSFVYFCLAFIMVHAIVWQLVFSKYPYMVIFPIILLGFSLTALFFYLLSSIGEYFEES